MGVDRFLIWVHLSANVIWIGSILSVALLLILGQPDAKVRGELAKSIYLRLATPGFVVAFIMGLVRFMMDVGHYGKTPWMHIKLTVALAVIGIHHVIGARAKKMAEGDVTDAGPTKALLFATVACVIAILFLTTFKVPGG